MRVGAVSYLNTRPLIHELAALAPNIDLVLDLPSRLADELGAGRLDVALIPSIEYFRHPDYAIISDACIACRGPVLSVKLFARVPIAEVRTLALDEGSRTSAVLAQLLLDKCYGVRPAIESLAPECGLLDTQADAVLLIGDRAIGSPAARFAAVWDLGDEWCRWTGLPFVFAMWVARQRVPQLAEVERALSAARNSGLAHLPAIAAAEAPTHGLTTPACLSYLRDNLHFSLGEDERQGLALFRRLALEGGYIDGVAPPTSAETTGAAS